MIAFLLMMKIKYNFLLLFITEWIILVLGMLSGVCCIVNNASMYSNTEVETLGESSFYTPVLKNCDQIWVVQFYSPECIPCQEWQSEFVKAAKLSKEEFTVK